MQESRFSTIRFNEWICVSAQYEKAIARIGRQVYQGYSRGLIEDHTTAEMCREISETFAEARLLRSEMEEELERDALDGLNVEEAAKADELRELSQMEQTKRKVKLKLTKFLGRAAINRSLASHRNKVKELSRDLGLRAMACYTDEPIIKVRGHKTLCQLAERLQDEADKKWVEITENNKETGGALSFHGILINFVGNFAKFSENTAVGKFILKFFKYDEKEEAEKLTRQFEGTNTAEALRVQMEEIDEPHLDVGREMDNMQQEYEETPEEWNLPYSEEFEQDEFPAAEAEEERWEPEADTWNPEAAIDDEFLDAVSDAPDLPAAPDFEPEPMPAPGRPTLLRKHSEPEAGDWPDAEPEPASLPRVGMNPNESSAAAVEDFDPMMSFDEPVETESAPAAPTPPPAAAPPVAASAPPAPEPEPEPEPEAFPPDPFSAQSRAANASQKDSGQDDWGWGGSGGDDGWGSSNDDNAAGFGDFSSNPGFDSSPSDMFKSDSKEESSPFGSDDAGLFDSGQSAPQTSEPAQPAAKKPPFVKSRDKSEPSNDWSQGGSGSWDNSGDGDSFGWGTDAASTPPAPTPVASEPTPPAPAPPVAPTPTPAAPPAQAPPAPAASMTAPAAPSPPSPGNDIPLPPTPPSPPSAAEPASNLGDDLLPDFLKEKIEDSSNDESTFIPELPSFLESEDGPKLEIVPFGSTSKDSEEDGGGDIFIPEMPDS